MIHRCTKNSWLLATTNTLLSSICKDTTYFNYDLLSMRSGGIFCHQFECESFLFTLVTCHNFVIDDVIVRLIEVYAAATNAEKALEVFIRYQ